MARIVIITYGSLGDLHPAIALALRLRDRGHRAEIATSEPYRPRIAALGLPFHGVRPSLSIADEAVLRRIMDGMNGSVHLMRDLVYPSAPEMFADLAPVVAGADLFVAGEMVCVAPLLSEITGVRRAFFALSPISFFTVHDPSLMPGPPGTRFFQSLGPTANRAMRTMARISSYRWWAPLRELHRSVGVPPGRSPFFEGKFSPHLNLALFSNALQAPPPDWPPHTEQTGFLFHDEADQHPQLPPTVEKFFNAGEPPLVFTLGSAAVHLAGDFYAQSARAAEILGRRALLLLGPNSAPGALPPSVLPWDYLPYAQVFPRAAAVVHQGGIGTTAQVLRAGRPMVVVPYAHDQFDNAARAARLGAAREVSRREYRAANVAATLVGLLANPTSADAAREIGEHIRAERGLERACDAIERALP